MEGTLPIVCIQCFEEWIGVFEIYYSGNHVL
jgi:hypothetical protein